jgi:hypothetical protein
MRFAQDQQYWKIRYKGMPDMTYKGFDVLFVGHDDETDIPDGHRRPARPRNRPMEAKIHRRQAMTGLGGGWRPSRRMPT